MNILIDHQITDPYAYNEWELKTLVDKTLGQTSKNSFRVINDTKSFDS
jgi:hypothetical protein